MATDLKTIQTAIQQSKAAWEAQDHPFLRLSPQDLQHRLGVIPDEQRLKELRALPPPDISRLVAEQLGFRLQTPQQTAPPVNTAGTPAAAFDTNLLTSEILQLISRQLLLCGTSVDWRNRKGRNNVTPVKDQGGCGSCVSFGTIGTLESMVLIEHDVSLDLSEAELLFCGGGSCGGWWPDSAVSYLVSKGVALESCFPYQDHNMPCATCAGRSGEAIKIAHHQAIFDVNSRRSYLCAVGPTMCVFAVYEDFFGYRSGVYSHVTGGLAGLHCVEVVGYDNTAKCWICKNSWGTGWGDGGFFKIAYGQCEIDTTYPFWGISGTQWFA